MDQDEELAARRVGTAVGGYTLERVLGVGGMASVFVGRRADGGVAAVKLLHAYLSSYPEVKSRFLREGPIGSALAAVGPLCEGLPQVFESGVAEDGTAFLAMEVLEGETLFDLLSRNGRLPVGQALWLAQHVLDVLAVAHAHAIVHRDLKPENVLLLQSGGLKVLDFGVAQVRGGLPDGGALPEKAPTKTGTVLGSARYMAPEQALGRVAEIDGRTDLFGLGATLFHALAGRPIHTDKSEGTLLIAAATKRAPPLCEVAPDVPAPVCAVVDLALCPEREGRYPDARTMRSDVAAIRAGKAPPYASARR